MFLRAARAKEGMQQIVFEQKEVQQKDSLRAARENEGYNKKLSKQKGVQQK